MGVSNTGITLHGNQVEVGGEPLAIGATVPDFTGVNKEMSEVSLSQFSDKVLVLLSLPSVDTPVCSVETKRFSEELSSLSDDVAVVTVSRDLPFALGRWCGAEGVENVTLLSDYKFRTFGQQFGCLWKDAELLCRSAFVVGKDGVVQYADYVAEISEEPDYEAILAKVKELC